MVFPVRPTQGVAHRDNVTPLRVASSTTVTDASDPPDEPPTDADVSPEDVYEEMEPFEPYTTGELAAVLDIPKRLARSLLDTLTAAGQIRSKEPEPERLIWVREPPKHECPACGHAFEIKYFHPVLQSVQFCPRCGAQLE